MKSVISGGWVDVSAASDTLATELEVCCDAFVGLEFLSFPEVS